MGNKSSKPQLAPQLAPQVNSTQGPQAPIASLPTYQSNYTPLASSEDIDALQERQEQQQQHQQVQQHSCKKTRLHLRTGFLSGPRVLKTADKKGVCI